MKLRLISTHSSWGRKQKIRVHQFPAVIGRDLSADICIENRWVSRRHCELLAQDGTVVVRDLQSRHGTLVNGHHVTESPLNAGDLLTIGLSTYEIDCQSAGSASSAVASMAV